MSAEWDRVKDCGNLESGPWEAGPWHQWGPYLAERAWGSVREDYSPGGDAWTSFPYDHARSRTYRWNEDGMAGISDVMQDLCLALALWNGRDDHLKERMFGLSGPQGNHGEDVKEYWWYLDATPSHSWLRWRYHYPQAAFPYQDLVAENARRDRRAMEYELLDTGVFDEDRYWVVGVDYAKDSPDEILMKITITNAGPEDDRLHVLPTLWFRNNWSLGDGRPVPHIEVQGDRLVAEHERLGGYELAAAPGPDGRAPQAVFCDNISNDPLLYGSAPLTPYPKDGINDHVVHGAATVNPDRSGTKAAWWYQVDVPAGQSVELRLRLSPAPDARSQRPAPHRRPQDWSGASFTDTMSAREREADEFYATLTPAGTGEAEAAVMRQAFAGMIWGKQFYPYEVARWLDGDPGQPPPPGQRLSGRNSGWRTLNAFDVISMPDAWEYPWFAAWDLAFHAVTLAHVDPPFAKHQLLLMLREWYSSPQGAIPAYEWNFSDVNPPVHAWAALRVFELDGGKDYTFLARVFDKLLINFTWWLNREDPDGNDVFQGGFLGLDNIGPIDRSQLPPGYQLAQADGTGWMAFYSLVMLRIAVLLAEHDRVHDDFVLRFFEQFALIAHGIDKAGMWDPDDGFFYDQLRYPDGHTEPIRARSLVGLLPVLATAVVDHRYLRDGERHQRRLASLVRHRGDVQEKLRRIGVINSPDEDGPVLISLVDPQKLVTMLGEVLDEDGMLAPTGIRSLSKRHRDHPVSVTTDGTVNSVDYEPAESTTAMYGGNSNWRGPVWFPLNVLLADALDRFAEYIGDDHKVQLPTGSGNWATLHEVADDVRRRLVSTFLPGPDGRRPVFGGLDRFQDDPRWNDAVLFFEYFNGDNGAGLGASHQTGWTGLVATLLAQPAVESRSSRRR